MNDKAIKTLEFDKIRALLAEECQSPMGMEIAEALQCHTSLFKVRRAQQETAEAVEYMRLTGSAATQGFDDIRLELNKARIGGTLQCAELLKVATVLRVCRNVRDSLTRGDSTPGETLLEQANQIVALTALENEIERCIENEERVADAASAELSRLRRGIAMCHNRIRQKLEQIIHSQRNADILMDAIVTFRNGRYVVPVKQEHRGRMPGIVHDQSGSGATLFVEPMEVVEINNELRQMQSEETEEVQRILQELSRSIVPNVRPLIASLQAMAQLDFFFAKARLAYKMRAGQPQMTESGGIVVVRGRHPLIDPKTVVPINLKLGGDFSVLLITGPNTGGKTVTLKTVGLFSLMAQAGLHLPADDGTVFPIFTGVYADIGDEQSIEQSLSTFSSHMKNLVSVLSEADEGSLVLLDELGAGTDPHEGAALAIAITEQFRSSGCLMMATTHYSELKAYALNTDGVENASMEFNLETLSPTYRLFMGIPGRSNAFEISRRMGLPDDVIEKAREHLSNEVIRFEDVLKSAEIHESAARREREEAEALKREMQSLQGRAKQEREKLEHQRAQILGQAKAEAEKLIAEARQEMDGVVEELKRLKQSGADARSIDRGIQEARDKLRNASRAAEKERVEPLRRPPKNLKPGDMVVLLEGEQIATVLSAPDAKGDVTVQAGIIKLTTNIKKLALADSADRKEERKKAREFRVVAVPRELDIRGMNGEEGLMEVDRYLDEAFRGGLNEVNIIHGKGTGRLREAVQDYLRHHPHVKTFRTGSFGEGEMGVTVVSIQ